MDMRFTEAEEAFRQEVRDFLKKELPPNWNAMTKEEFFSDEGWAFYREFTRKLAAKGWLQMHWPVEYGGQAASPMKMTVFVEEMAYKGAPVVPEASWIGPAIIIHGTEEQKKSFLPKMAAGELEWSLGFSEPGAGSDLFGVQTRADEQDDCYVVNGQKIFATLADRADYCYLVTRTDPDLPKHSGISVFMADMKTPGITVRPLIDMGGSHALNEVFFDNVRLSKDCMLGDKNGGLSVILTMLNMERGTGTGADTAARCQRVLDRLTSFCRERTYNGRPLLSDPAIKHALVEREVEVEVTRLLGYRVVWLLTKGIVADTEGWIAKIYGNETQQRVAKTGLQVLGLYSGLKSDPKWAPLARDVWDMLLIALSWMFVGGTNEILRNVIAMRGLGLPKVQI